MSVMSPICHFHSATCFFDSDCDIQTPTCRDQRPLTSLTSLTSQTLQTSRHLASSWLRRGGPSHVKRVASVASTTTAQPEVAGDDGHAVHRRTDGRSADIYRAATAAVLPHHYSERRVCCSMLARLVGRPRDLESRPCARRLDRGSAVKNTERAVQVVTLRGCPIASKPTTSSAAVLIVTLGSVATSTIMRFGLSTESWLDGSTEPNGEPGDRHGELGQESGNE